MSKLPSPCAPRPLSPSVRSSGAVPPSATSTPTARMPLNRSRPTAAAMAKVNTGINDITSPAFIGVDRDSPTKNSPWFTATPSMAQATRTAMSRRAGSMVRPYRSRASTPNTRAPTPIRHVPTPSGENPPG